MRTPALFLDRDGVIIYDSGYVKEATLVRLMPNIESLILAARKLNWKIVVVTNQSGIGRGRIELHEYQAVSARMLELLAAQGLGVDHIYFAPFHAGLENPSVSWINPRFIHHGIPEQGKWDLGWRKPMPGMIWQAAHDLNIDLSLSVMVGDRVTDQVVGCLAGIPRTYQLLSEIYESESAEFDSWKLKIPELRQQATHWLAQNPALTATARLEADLALIPHFIRNLSEIQL